MSLLDPYLLGRACERITKEESGSWEFRFGGSVSLRVECRWRTVQSGRIVLADEDDAKWFGRELPVDAVATAVDLFLGKAISEVRLDDQTSDLVLVFEDGTRLELWNSSSGYEAWILSDAEHPVLVCQGGGRLVRMHEIPAKPESLRGDPLGGGGPLGRSTDGGSAADHDADLYGR